MLKEKNNYTTELKDVLSSTGKSFPSAYKIRQ